MNRDEGGCRWRSGEMRVGGADQSAADHTSRSSPWTLTRFCAQWFGSVCSNNESCRDRSDEFGPVRIGNSTAKVK